jgi:hypothetical protein
MSLQILLVLSTKPVTFALAFYSAEALPETALLVQDMRACLDLDRILADKDVALTEPVEVSAGGDFIEDLTKFRWSRRIDRDVRAIQLVKKAKGYTCEVCGLNFESRYGEIGKGFIEIHHLVPISELQGLMVSSLEPKIVSQLLLDAANLSRICAIYRSLSGFFFIIEGRRESCREPAAESPADSDSAKQSGKLE